MDTQRIRKVGSLLLLSLVFGCAQDRGGSPAAGEIGPIETVLEAVPAETLPGLPVSIIVRQTNTGAVPEYVPGKLHVWYGSLELTVTRPDGREERVDRGYNPHNYKTWTGIPLAPGAKRAVKEWAGWGDSGPFFPEPGVYEVRARAVDPSEVYSDGLPREKVRRYPADRWVSVPPVKVVVRKPTGREVEAARLFPSKGDDGESLRNLLVTQHTDVRSKRVVERLERVAREYRDTAYGLHAAYLLAIHKASDSIWLESYKEVPADDEADLREAVDLLLDLERLGPPEELRAEVQLNLARYYIRLGDWTNAEERVRWLEGREIPVTHGSSQLRYLRETISKRLQDGSQRNGGR